MKSAIFFAGLALAAPAVQKRDVQTDVVVVTEWTTTTTYVPQPTPNAFFEQQPSVAPVQAVAVQTSAAAAAAPTTAAVKPQVDAYTPPAATPTPTPTPAASTYQAPAAAQQQQQAQPAAQAAPVAQAAAPKAATSGGGPSGNGDATFYEVGMGSCGHQSSDGENVVALSYLVMGTSGNPNSNPLCGKTITINYQGKTSTGTVVDTCMGCDAGSIDLSPGFFSSAIGSQSLGRVSGVTWSVS